MRNIFVWHTCWNVHIWIPGLIPWSRSLVHCWYDMLYIVRFLALMRHVCANLSHSVAVIVWLTRLLAHPSRCPVFTCCASFITWFLGIIRTSFFRRWLQHLARSLFSFIFPINKCWLSYIFNSSMECHNDKGVLRVHSDWGSEIDKKKFKITNPNQFWPEFGI